MHNILKQKYPGIIKISRYRYSASNILLQHVYKKLSNIFYLTFKACNCNADGSTDITCDGNGICNCKPNFKNDKCDACGPGFFNFSTCEGKKYCRGEPLQVC